MQATRLSSGQAFQYSRKPEASPQGSTRFNSPSGDPPTDITPLLLLALHSLLATRVFVVLVRSKASVAKCHICRKTLGEGRRIRSLLGNCHNALVRHLFLAIRLLHLYVRPADSESGLIASWFLGRELMALAGLLCVGTLGRASGSRSGLNSQGN